MTDVRRRHLVTILLLPLAAVSVAACSNGDDSVDTTVASTGDILSMNLTADLTPKGVLLAAVILSTGDIEAALSDGLVTVPEVDAAREAVAAGTLDLWRQRAEAGN